MHPIVAAAVFILCGEKVALDRDLMPQFTANQIACSAAATRDGLARWAATEHGRALIGRFDGKIVVTEDPLEDGEGRAPQPSIATLASLSGSTRVYSLILNPTFVLPKGVDALPNQPSAPADMMSVAWAAEMLHIDFYSRGVSLPHHQRHDFQAQWHVVAEELGFPNLRHDDGDEARSSRSGLGLRIISMH